MKTFYKFQLLFLGLILLGCEKEAPVDLGYGYSFFTTNADNHYIIQDVEFIVDSNIVEYKVVGHFVVGLRARSDFPDDEESDTSTNFGFFILNLESGVLEEGLSKSDVDCFLTEQSESLKPLGRGCEGDAVSDSE